VQQFLALIHTRLYVYDDGHRDNYRGSGDHNRSADNNDGRYDNDNGCGDNNDRCSLRLPHLCRHRELALPSFSYRRSV
jgi:hypothetical protein